MKDARKSNSGLVTKVALVLASTVLALGATEVGLRFAGFGNALARWHDPNMGLRLLPNQTREMGQRGRLLGEATINSVGFRGPSYDHPKGEGVTRVACVGDSYTFGWAVEDQDAYPFLLEQMLRKGGLEQVEVMNFGVPGYNTKDTLRNYTQIVRGWEPDVVLLGYVLNDTEPGFSALPKHLSSRWYRILGRTAMVQAFDSRVRGQIPWLHSERDKGHRLKKRHYNQNRKTIRSDPDAEVSQPYWRASMGHLASLVDEVRSDGGEFVLIGFPANNQIRAVRSLLAKRETNTRRALRKAWERASVTQNYLERNAEELEVPFINLLQGFVDAEENPFGTTDQGHPSKVGYRISADVIAAYLLDQL